MGWRLKWASSFGTGFDYDFHVSFIPEEQASGKVLYKYPRQEISEAEHPGISVFFRDPGGTVFHTYSRYRPARRAAPRRRSPRPDEWLRRRRADWCSNPGGGMADGLYADMIRSEDLRAILARGGTVDEPLSANRTVAACPHGPR